MSTAESILQFLDEADVWMTASNIHYNVGGSQEYIRQVAKELADEGLVDRDRVGEKPYYRINDAGRDFLREGDA